MIDMRRHDFPFVSRVLRDLKDRASRDLQGLIADHGFCGARINYLTNYQCHLLLLRADINFIGRNSLAWYVQKRSN